MEIDNIEPALNPVRAADLETILNLTPARLRVQVALAFCDMSQPDLAVRAGLDPRSICRWLNARSHRLPYGSAARIAKVFGGVPCEVLFADWLD